MPRCQVLPAWPARDLLIRSGEPSRGRLSRRREMGTTRDGFRTIHEVRLHGPFPSLVLTFPSDVIRWARDESMHVSRSGMKGVGHNAIRSREDARTIHQYIYTRFRAASGQRLEV